MPHSTRRAGPSALHKPFDLVVLGAGSGGMAAAKHAARRGARVALVEDDQTDGTCVLRGCVPKKLMVEAAHLGHCREIAQAYGWAVAPKPHDFHALVQTRDAIIKGLVENHDRALEELGVERVAGFGTLKPAFGTLTVASKARHTQLTYRHLLVATGSAPTRLAIPGAEHLTDSDAFFRLIRLPKNVAIIGGGYIAVEFATLLCGLGAQVTLLVRDELLRGFDRALARRVEENLRGAGVHLAVGMTPKRLEKKSEARLRLVSHDRAEVCHTVAGLDCVVAATGRRPRSRGLGLEALGVGIDERDAIEVDAQHQTSVKNLFAVGDVINRVNLTPVAIRAGRSVSERLFGDGDAFDVDYEGIPSAIFTQPPAAAVGITEEQATQHVPRGFVVFETHFLPLTYSPVKRPLRRKTWMKLIVGKEDGRVLGIHLVGDHAPELIQPLAIAMRAGATKADFDRTLAVHPTQAEELVLLAHPRD